MSETAVANAEHFIHNETQFHLGFLPTEQSNPLTKTLESDFQSSTEQGVRTLQRADRSVLAMVERIFRSSEYAGLVQKGEQAIRNGRRIIFSGCGATGRLSILLESMWRKHCAEHPESASYADCVESIMTGGDYALVRSVEFFEDYQQFGRKQVAEAGMKAGDVLVAITEGGETSSVLGTVFEALDRGCAVFLLFNNPAELLAEHLERSRKAIQDPRVCVLDLSCGPMALAGSTRMQATTSEQLVAGAALETIMHRLTGETESDYISAFRSLLEALELPENSRGIADYIDFETEIYRKKGKVTYFANDYLLDIFTDTTERSPTFMLPPFRRIDDTTSPQSWAFVKNPLYSTAKTWEVGMHRPLRCLNWTLEDYKAMNADAICTKPPVLSGADLLKFEIGKESPELRADSGNDAGVLITLSADPELESAFQKTAGIFRYARHLAIGQETKADYLIRLPKTGGALHLMEHMAIKLVLNTISTGTMARLGRITGNWMSWVDCTNKKLLDRGTRLLVEIAGVDYRTACIALFEALEQENNCGEEKSSPVQIALKKLKH